MPSRGRTCLLVKCCDALRNANLASLTLLACTLLQRQAEPVLLALRASTVVPEFFCGCCIAWPAV